MIVLDTNILVYAYHPQLPQHETVKSWLESVLNQRSSVGLVWPAITGFVRISTNRRIFETPMTIKTATGYVADLLDYPLVRELHTTEKHRNIFSRLLIDTGAVGDIVADAHIAAVAIEHKASVASCDRDFRRFSDHVKIINPLKA